MRRILFICLVLLFVQVDAMAQRQSYVDSLLAVVQKTPGDTSKAKIYIQISDWLIDNDIEKALVYADTVAMLAKRHNWKAGIASSLANYGNIYNFKGEYVKALQYFQKAYEVNKELKSDRGMARSLYSLGSASERLSNYTDAADYYFKSLSINETIPNNEQAIASCLGGIAVIYFLQNDFKKSLEYSLRVVEKQQAIHNELGLANEYVNIADTYYRLGDSSNASQYNFKALELSKKLGLTFQEGIVYSQLGVLTNDDPAKSLDYLFKAQKILESISPSFSSTILNGGEIGRAFLKVYKRDDVLPVSNDHSYVLPVTKKEILQQAGLYLQKAVVESRATGDKDKEAAFSRDLAEVQFLEGDFRDAYANLHTSYVLHDSLYSQENKNKIAAIESQRKVDLKDKEIEISKLVISNQQKKQIGLIAGICLLGIIGGLLYWQGRTRKKTNTTLRHLNGELDEANQVKAKFFGILSHDLRSPVANLVNFLHLQKNSPGLLSPAEMEASQEGIKTAAESLLETMEAMLLWSKEQMKFFKPKIRSVAVADLFDHLRKFFPQSNRVNLRFEAEPGLLITGDENYLQVIMQNLMANAVRALVNKTDATITWKAWKEGDRVWLSITDNGPGISEEQARKLQEATEGNNARHGFGLHLVRDLARAIQYDISVQSRPGAGTSIILSPLLA